MYITADGVHMDDREQRKESHMYESADRAHMDDREQKKKSDICASADRGHDLTVDSIHISCRSSLFLLVRYQFIEDTV